VGSTARSGRRRPAGLAPRAGPAIAPAEVVATILTHADAVR
jgi:hypothetical protein